VRRYTDDDLMKTHDIRCRLEPHPGAGCAMNAMPEELEGLAGLLDGFDEAAPINDAQALKRADYELER
jgi:DNA-binding GntR family transcriptional regulator